MQLKPGTELQGGRYRIVQVLGQGGFGITYLANQPGLNRKVAIKEFFMKEYCDRDDSTSRVTLGTTAGNRELVAKFRGKFIREAQMIAGLDHPNVVKIFDVFEENGTAYFAMEYIAGGSLKELVAEEGRLSEGRALKYIREAGEALHYAHAKKVLHFDVKPSNIMLRDSGTAVLIDFGVSKHYDEGGHVTSSTPVGISKGYAPMEQYRQEDISTFTPATDIYALGATLFTLLTGEVPPDAAVVYEEDALPPMPAQLSATVRNAVAKAMSPRRKDRPQTIDAFFALMDSDEGTAVLGIHSTKPDPAPKSNSKPKSKAIPGPESNRKRKPKIVFNRGFIISILSAVVVAAVITGLFLREREVPDSFALEYVTDQSFNNLVLGEYLYTGPLDSEGLPHGEGKAVFVKNKDQEALSYSGPFVHGIMKGTGVSFIFITGDTFTGSFGEDNHFLEGVLTKKESGEYYEGTFKDGAPLEGVWYDKNGNKIQDVKNGK